MSERVYRNDKTLKRWITAHNYNGSIKQHLVNHHKIKIDQNKKKRIENNIKIIVKMNNRKQIYILEVLVLNSMKPAVNN